MKKLFLAVAFALTALTLPTAAHAQQAGAGNTVVQETSTDPRAATLNASATGTAQQTLTLTCPSGQFVYLVAYEEFKGATTAPAATLTVTTTTNLNGKKWYGSVAATATEFPRIEFLPSKAVKAQSNSATIVSNAAITSVNYGLSADYFCGL